MIYVGDVEPVGLRAEENEALLQKSFSAKQMHNSKTKTYAISFHFSKIVCRNLMLVYREFNSFLYHIFGRFTQLWPR
jgi:hypothetical protein